MTRENVNKPENKARKGLEPTSLAQTCKLFDPNPNLNLPLTSLLICTPLSSIDFPAKSLKFILKFVRVSDWEFVWEVWELRSAGIWVFEVVDNASLGVWDFGALGARGLNLGASNI